VHGAETLADGGKVQHSEQRLAVLQERDAAPPQRQTVGEVVGAIQRIDDPGELGAVIDQIAFLAQQAVVGIASSQRLLDETIDLVVGLGDEAAVGLSAGGRLAKPMAQPQRGFVGEAVGEVMIGGKFCVRGSDPFSAAQWSTTQRTANRNRESE